jgi:hypothetical protein
MTSVRERLQALPFVVVKRLNGRLGFFTAGRMFALLSNETLMIRVPEHDSGPLLDPERGGGVLGFAIPSALVWVEIPVAGAEPDDLALRAARAHEAVRAESRRVRRERSAQRIRRARTSA